MIKQLAWNTFKKTGNINSYLEFAELENAERQMQADEKKKPNLGENIGINTKTREQNKWE